MEPNPFLRPETIRTEEGIWEQGFANQITGLTRQQTDPNTGLLVFTNSESVQSRGLEMELGGKTRSGIEGGASYTLQRTEISSTDVRLEDSPAQLGKVNIVFPITRLKLAIAFELQYTASRKIPAGGQVDGYVLSNLTVSSREFAKGFRLSGSVYNIFNTSYGDPVGPEIVGSAVRQNGREYRIQLTRTFHFQ
jgi:outer membrane receptor protein involved in Fe transport